jgi:hypothetical protein
MKLAFVYSDRGGSCGRIKIGAVGAIEVACLSGPSSDEDWPAGANWTFGESRAYAVQSFVLAVRLSAYRDVELGFRPA